MEIGITQSDQVVFKVQRTNIKAGIRSSLIGKAWELDFEA